MRKFESIVLVALATICSSMEAEEIKTATSPDHKVALLELYTSEGCNSCPPAEKWLGQLEGKGYSPDKVIPIALHVDYWDYLGWRDIYADRLHSQRQQQHVQRNKLNTAYTPQLILNGKNLRPSRLLNSRLKNINSITSEVEIKLSAREIKNNQITVNALVKSKNKNTESNNLFLALVSNKIISNVRAGENAGRELTHYYVVHELIGPMKNKPSGVSSHKKSFIVDNDDKTSELSLVAFVEDNRGGILQSIRLRLE